METAALMDCAMPSAGAAFNRELKPVSFGTMSPHVSKARPTLSAALAVMVLAGTVYMAPANASTMEPGDYPSWEEVEQAKSTEAAKAAEVARIGELLDGLQAQSEALGITAVNTAADYAVSDAELQAASTRLEGLRAQLAQMDAELVRHKRDLGSLAAQAYRTGGTNMGFFVAMDAVQANTVHGLNVAQIVGEKTAGLVQKTAGAKRTAASLAAQESAAEAERERLALRAREKLEAARSAQDSMARQVQEEQQRGNALMEQLASLKGTTAAVERTHRQGQAALAGYEAAQAAKRNAVEQARQRVDAGGKDPVPAALPVPVPVLPAPAPSQPVPPIQAPVVPAPAAPPVAAAPAAPLVPTPATPPVAVVPSVPGGAVNDPAAAKSYAAGRLGAYGWGQDQFLCLARLWTKESNWLTTATNPYSGAYGIAQALPASKYASAGSDWVTSYRTQIEWGLGYIRGRYGSPCAAWDHSVARNWY